jgi:putative phosphoesterase
VRIGLLADTQGSFDVDALVRHATAQFGDVDEIWHAGDWGSEAVLNGLRGIGPPLVVVNGNAPDDAHYPMTVEREIEGVRVGMIHNLEPKRRAWANGFDVVIHGHTHRWRDEVVGRTRFINPGTATRPQFGGTERTMARLRFGEQLVVEKLIVPNFAKSRRNMISL